MKERPTTREVAELLAKERMREDTALHCIYQVPDDNEVRLIEISEAAPQTGEILPFRFKADPPDVPCEYVMVLLHPNDWKRRAELNWPPGFDNVMQLIVATDLYAPDTAKAKRLTLQVAAKLHQILPNPKENAMSIDLNYHPTLVSEDPKVFPMAAMELDYAGLENMTDWLKGVRPECFDSSNHPDLLHTTLSELFPHDCTEPDGRVLTHNELLVELAGRKCYDSFGKRAGQKTNKSYIENTQKGDIPHASIMYHAKMTFFIAGISRRVSHELIRHYVGADRTEEGSPSQESTRYVEHSGRYIVHPGILSSPTRLNAFQKSIRENRKNYCEYIYEEFSQFSKEHNGEQPKGMARKRIFETASTFLSHSAETTFVWTTNPIALAKLFRERDNDAADLEFQRLARVWKKVALEKWPNLFPQPWMKADETR